MAALFTSTWCDWYLRESRPEVSKNCINAQRQVNTLSQQQADIRWLGIISRLWTGEAELRAYKSKYDIEYEILIDTTNQEFHKFRVKQFPTLILFHNNKEVFRTTDFRNVSSLSRIISDFRQRN